MLFSSLSAVAILAAVAHADVTRLQQRTPYKLARMPESALFGLSRRDNEGYQPETAVCGEGNTCAEACGDGYEQCASTDSAYHCFNPTVGEQCCGSESGDSCEAGFYCTHDRAAKTWCCPDDMDLAQCAESFDIEGELFTATSSAAEQPTTTTSVEVEETTVAPTTTSVAGETTTTSAAAAEETTSCTTESTTYEAESSTSSYSQPYNTTMSYSPTSAPAGETPSGTGPVPIPSDAAASGNQAAVVIAMAVFAALL